MIGFRHKIGGEIRGGSEGANIELYNELLAQAKSLVARAQEADFGGWVDLPINYDREEFERILRAAEKIHAESEYLVCIGIGGSYLGHRAIIEALGKNVFNSGVVENNRGEKRTKILYTGNSLSGSEISDVLAEIAGKDFSVLVISKSGTTLEPAVAFRVLKKALAERYGEEEAARRIYATTDASTGALYTEAIEKGYERFVVPNNIGGRYSVLSAVGLLPMAVAGVDIRLLMDGAEEERSALISDGGMAAVYAATRNYYLRQGYDIEVLANFQPRFAMFNEWWKQLFGESEGKEGKGIFPASMIYSTDLHSMGQYLQEGRRNLQETFVEFAANDDGPRVPETEGALDGLTYLEGATFGYMNRIAEEATRAAHEGGGVPVSRIYVPGVDERSLGALVYFFEMSCALSGYLLGVNPFDQPGVEGYKKNMFRLLGRP